MVSVVLVRVLLGRNLQTDLDALDRMVVDSLVGSGDNALSGGDDKEREGNDESMVEEIESQVRHILLTCPYVGQMYRVYYPYFVI